MENLIIYKTETGGVAIIIPIQEWLDQPGNSLEKLIKLRVPENTPYKIISSGEIPTNRKFRDAWEWAE